MPVHPPQETIPVEQLIQLQRPPQPTNQQIHAGDPVCADAYAAGARRRRRRFAIRHSQRFPGAVEQSSTSTSQPLRRRRERR